MQVANALDCARAIPPRQQRPHAPVNWALGLPQAANEGFLRPIPATRARALIDPVSASERVLGHALLGAASASTADQRLHGDIWRTIAICRDRPCMPGFG